MNAYNFFDKHDGDVVVILGFFDCLHLGHIALVKKGAAVAEKLNAVPVVFTYSNDMNAVLGDKSGQVLTCGERLKKLEKLGINAVITCNFDENYALMSGDEFLNILFSDFSLKGIVCGYDYSFGNGAKSKVEDLRAFADKRGVPVFVESPVVYGGERVSTTLIKKYLSQKEIKKANVLLSTPYFLTGKVVKGKQNGRKIGFPTANVALPSDKFRIGYGVYKTRVMAESKVYKAITNFGAQPTFSSDEVVVECHLKDFDGDLYGKEITVIFDDYIRDIVKFYDIDELKKQLTKDMEALND